MDCATAQHARPGRRGGEATELSVLHGYGEELERRLRLRTHPLAVKLLAKRDDVPGEALRPMRDLGHHLDLCQAFALSRRDGTTLALLKEDMWCFEPVVGYGLAEPPEHFLAGHNRFPEDVMTLEAGSNYAHEILRMEIGEMMSMDLRR